MNKLIDSINNQKFKTKRNPIKEWWVVGDELTQWVHSLEVPWCFQYLSSREKNISVKRNMALEHATGDWILMIDSDQYFGSDTFIQEMLEFADTNKYKILRIVEQFSHEGFYLRRSYHKLRQLYWDKSETGIPRLFSRDLIKLTRYDPNHLHGEDLKFFQDVVGNSGTLTGRFSTSPLIHDEDFHFWQNMKKTHKAKEQEGLHGGPHFRLSMGEIMGISKFYLPGALFILGTRAMARRI
jgi:glycosyltransferase involved in cell wall biosynthesis